MSSLVSLLVGTNPVRSGPAVAITSFNFTSLLPIQLHWASTEFGGEVGGHTDILSVTMPFS